MTDVPLLEESVALGCAQLHVVQLEKLRNYKLTRHLCLFVQEDKHLVENVLEFEELDYMTFLSFSAGV